MKIITPRIGCLLAGLLAATHWAHAQPELIIRDSPADTGAEPDLAIDPSVNPGGEMWVSQDIWVTQSAMAGYTPYPFASASPPMWLTVNPNPNQNPQYRDPLLSQPNYLYVRISNVGTSASRGTEQLHAYWAKASTGLSWPSQWVDYQDTYCGPSELYGLEITKPRRNINDPSVPISEVNHYLSAINAIAQNPSLQFPDGVQYWYKQNVEHYFVAAKYLNGPTLSSGEATFAAHSTDGFWPWHREYINRYETLLREADPTVTLFYWDWTTDPAQWSPAVVSAVTAASPNGLGTFSGKIASAFTSKANIDSASAPLAPFPFSVDLNSLVVSRFVGATPPATADTCTTGQDTFSDARAWAEGEAVNIVLGSACSFDQTHDSAHPYIGGSGNMASLPWAAQDPFFFLLHANADRLWSQWQRAISLPGGTQYGDRFNASPTGGNVLAYSGSQNYMYQPMAPWNGLTYNGTTPHPLGAPEIILSPLQPWRQSAGDQTTLKDANDNSVVDPPVYDTAPLTIPVLQPGQTVVIEIPWYPPNPMNYSCFGTDAGHVCLLARITTSSTAPYGMDFPETADLYSNVQNNNKIAWRNEMVLDGGISPPGPLINDAVFVRGLSGGTPVELDLALNPVGGKSLANFGTVLLDLGPILYQRWLVNGSVGSGFKTNTGFGSPTALQLVSSNGYVGNLPMASNELARVEVALVLSNQYANPNGQTYSASLTQSGGGVVGTQNQTVGGQLFTFNFNQLDVVPRHSVWRYFDTGQYPGNSWNQVGFDDSPWPSGAAKLGYGLGDETTVLSSGPVDASYITTWFRYDFLVNDPAFFTNLWLELQAYDGAVVYLNGVEIARHGMPNGTVTPATPASNPVAGLAAETYYPFNVSSYLSLLAETNVLAVEVHVADTNNSAELGLDLELIGNLFTPRFPPQAALLTSLANNAPDNAPNNGLYLLGRPIMLAADTVATVNPVQFVSYYSDGAFLGTVATPPYAFTWNSPPLGVHQITTVPVDSAGLSSESYVTLDVLTNVPPNIYLTSPLIGHYYPTNTPIALTANVQKIGGGIQKVDFYYAQHGTAFSVPQNLAGTVTAAPYTLQLSGLAPGGYMIYAIATDNAGATSYAVPVHIVVAVNPSLKIGYTAPFYMVSWSPTNSVLQQASSVSGPWQTLTNATSPYGFLPDPAVPNLFFRAAYPPGDAFCAPQ